MAGVDPLVSVVTPVYNGEPHLAECIQSVLSQTYTRWDYTIVNNCSTDRTLDIAREYAAKDPRLRIHNNEGFVPVIANYNVAFRQVSPESRYCKVVAADDWLFPECLEKMVRIAQQNARVAIVGSYNLLGTKLMYGEILPYHTTVMPGRDACRWRLLGGRNIFGAASLGLFRADIVRRRPSFYNESNLHADMEGCYELLEDGDLGFVHQVLTFRREHDESLTSRVADRLNTYQPNRLKELVRHGPRYLSDAEQKSRRRELLRTYYAYLATQVYERRGEEFWNFHKSKLAEVGLRLSKIQLARAFAAYTLDLLLNPKITLERLAGRSHRTYLEGLIRTPTRFSPSAGAPSGAWLIDLEVDDGLRPHCEREFGASLPRPLLSQSNLSLNTRALTLRGCTTRRLRTARPSWRCRAAVQEVGSSARPVVPPPPLPPPLLRGRSRPRISSTIPSSGRLARDAVGGKSICPT